jgi:hypothetical protein
MESAETIKYLQLIEDYLRQSWLESHDPETSAELEYIAAKIAELKKSCEQ